MKKLIVVLMLIAPFALGQMINSPIVKAKLLKTYTNYTTSTADTTGYISLADADLYLAREVCLIGIATDSIQATVQVIGRNTQIVTGTTYLLTDVYTDSISSLGAGTTAWAATNPKTKVIVVKGPGVNVLEGCDQFKVATLVINAASNGTTSGRYLKWYLWVKW